MSIATIILTAANSAGVSGALLLAICTHESKLTNVVNLYDNGSPSYGVCQIKEETAKSVGFSGQTSDLMNPKINAKYAALYLKKQLDRYDNNWCKSVAAYNSGTYNPSSTLPGKPRNIKYIKYISALLDKNNRDRLTCITRDLAVE